MVFTTSDHWPQPSIWRHGSFYIYRLKHLIIKILHSIYIQNSTIQINKTTEKWNLKREFAVHNWMKNLMESLQHYQLQNCKKPSTRRKLKVQISLAGNNIVRAQRESVLRCFEDEMKGKSEIARAERLGEHLTPLACLNVKGTELRLRCRFRVNSVDIGPVWINMSCIRLNYTVSDHQFERPEAWKCLHLGINFLSLKYLLAKTCYKEIDKRAAGEFLYIRSSKVIIDNKKGMMRFKTCADLLFSVKH